MKIIKIKLVQIFSNGSLIISNTNFINSKQFVFNEKDNKNFFLNKKKKIIYKAKSDYSSSYINKYVTSK